MIGIIQAHTNCGDSITRDMFFCQDKVFGRVLDLMIIFR
jgi:hypothetical protein